MSLQELVAEIVRHLKFSLDSYNVEPFALNGKGTYDLEHPNGSVLVCFSGYKHDGQQSGNITQSRKTFVTLWLFAHNLEGDSASLYDMIESAQKALTSHILDGCNRFYLEAVTPPEFDNRVWHVGMEFSVSSFYILGE